VRREWKNLHKVEVGSYNKVLAPSNDNRNFFAEMVIDIYTAVMKAESEGMFPMLEKAREILQTDAFKKGAIPEVLHCPHYRGRLPNNDNEEEEEDAVTEQVYYDNPMRKDLNKKIRLLISLHTSGASSLTC